MANSFVFVGFVPSEELTKLAQRVYREIIDLCPQDGDVSGEICSRGNEFICRMVVDSFALAFNVESVATEAFRALQGAHRDAKHSISQWHKRRFSA